MSQPVPVAAATPEASTAPSRRTGADADADAFGATLREQMPGTARDAAPAGKERAPARAGAERDSARTGSARDPAPAPSAARAGEVPADTVHAADASLDAQQQLLREEVDAVLLESAPDPAALALAPPAQVAAALIAPVVAAPPVAMHASNSHAPGAVPGRGQGVTDAVRSGVHAALTGAVNAAAPYEAVTGHAAFDLQADAAPEQLPIDGVLRALDAAVRPGAPPAPAAALPAALAPLAAPSAAVSHALAPRSDALPPALPPVDDPQWGAALGARLVWSAAHGTHSASIALNPPELGPVNVSLTLGEDEARVSFVSQHLAVRDAIEAALPRLRELFADGGLLLGEVDISTGGDRSGAQRDPAADTHPRTAARAEPETAPGASAAVRLADGLVDTFA